MALEPYKYYKDMPEWAKGIVVIGVLGAVFIIIKTFTKRLSNIAKTAEEKKTNDQQKEEIQELQQQGQKLSYPLSQYNAWANAIKTQFDGCDITGGQYSIFGTNYGSRSAVVVGNIIAKMKNDADMLQLSIAYGVRSHDQCGLWNSDFMGNLNSAVTDELTQGEIKVLNEFMAKKGLKYRF